MISFALTEDQRMLQELVRKFAEGEIRPRLRECEKQGVPAELQRKFDELGLALVDVPEDLGGMGLGLFTAVLVHEELAWGDPGLSVALWAPHFAPRAISTLGEAAQAKRLLARFADGARGAVAWSEAPRGPATGFATTARRDGDHWVLDGEKLHVVNAGVADTYVVFAQTDASLGWGGVGAFVVDANSPGVEAGARAEWVGLETVRAGAVKLAGCRVPDEARLPGASHVADLRRLYAAFGLVTAARQVGLARASYEYALGYTQDRVAFGKPVAHFQSISFTLAEMHMDVEAARWMVWRAATELDRAGDANGVEAAVANAAKAAVHANEAAWRVADHGVQLLGGAGYIQDYPAEKWMRDTRALSFIGGADEVAQLVVAAAALAAPNEFGVGLPEPWLQPVVT
jgi:acyl-CoA dehydrogenase